MPYTITVTTTTGTKQVTVNPQTEDNSTSLTLIGASYQGYGQALNQDLVNLMQSYAGTSSPLNANLGQLWLNASPSPVTLNYFDGAAWNILASKAYVDAQIAAETAAIEGLFGSAIAGNALTFVGDVVGTGVNNITLTLATQPGVIAGTYTKVTVNSKGLVTAGTSLTSSDIQTGLGFLPIQQGGGYYQTSDKIYLGLDSQGSGLLRLSIDGVNNTADYGTVPTTAWTAANFLNLSGGIVTGAVTLTSSLAVSGNASLNTVTTAGNVTVNGSSITIGQNTVYASSAPGVSIIQSNGSGATYLQLAAGTVQIMTPNLQNYAPLLIGQASQAIHAMRFDQIQQFVNWQFVATGYAWQQTASQNPYGAGFTLTSPPWCTKVFFQLVGAGGSGFYAGNGLYSGAGGGAGGYAEGYLFMPAGSAFYVTLGSTNGAGVIGGVNYGGGGATGGTSTISIPNYLNASTPAVIAYGGQGGQFVNTNNTAVAFESAGGQGGQVSVPATAGVSLTLAVAGGWGGDGQLDAYTTRSGYGADGPWGGSARAGSGYGTSGTSWGAGGAGSYYGNQTANQNAVLPSGFGAPGFFRCIYLP